MKKKIISIIGLVVCSLPLLILALSTDETKGANIITIILFSLLFLFGIIFCIANLIVDYKKQKQNFEENLKKLWEEKGLELEIAYRKDDFILLLDRNKGKFSIDFLGNIYDISDITGYKANRIFNGRNYVGQYITIYVKNKNDNFRDIRLEVGTKNKYGYSKNTSLYNLSEQRINEYLNILGTLIQDNKNDFYAKNNFVPREEFWFNGQMFSYDLQSKKFCTFTYLGFVIYDFNNFLEYHIEKDSKKIDKFNWEKALVGALVGGGVGASIWAKDTETICANLKLTLECDLGFSPTSDNTEFVLIDNQYLNEQSSLYKQVTTFIDSVTRICKLIEKQK